MPRQRNRDLRLLDGAYALLTAGGYPGVLMAGVWAVGQVPTGLRGPEWGPSKRRKHHFAVDGGVIAVAAADERPVLQSEARATSSELWRYSEAADRAPATCGGRALASLP